MRIAVVGIKGGVGKTTFSRLICEFFSEGFSDAYMSNTANKDVRLWNITRSELGAGRFHDLLTYVDDIFIKSSETFCKKLGETLGSDQLSIYDFGSDTMDMLFDFEKSDAGASFFSSIDYLFLPIKADDESFKSANYILDCFAKYENVKFVIALTEYHDSLDIEFHEFLYSKVHQTLNKLTKKGRAKQICIPFTKFIRDSQRDGQTLTQHSETLNESERIKFRQFRDELYDSFASALLGQNQTIAHRKVYSYCESLSENEKAYLQEMRKDLDRLGSAIESSLPDLQAVKKLSDVLIVPGADDALQSLINKLKTLSKNTWYFIIISSVIVPFIIFGLVGYFWGYTIRENKITNEIQNEIRFSNKLSEDLFRYNASSNLQFIEDTKRKVFEIRCIENDEKCVNRFDSKKNVGIFEIKNPKDNE